ncbi:MAG: RodZ domain-containing protein [Oceanidesulfovibrio sp.]
MSLKELGEKLREERKRQGLSLEVVQERSKISPNILEAIEEGRQDLLPHPVYVRGFLKTYLSVLGLDPNDPELGLDTVFEGVEPPRSKVRRHKPLSDVTPYPMQREPKRSNKPLILLVLLLLAAGGGYFIWQSLKPAVPHTTEENATMEEAAEAPATPQPEPAPGEALPDRPAAPQAAESQPSAQANATEGNATAAENGVDSEIEDIARTIESALDEGENATTAAEAAEQTPEVEAETPGSAGNATTNFGGELDAEKLALFEQAMDSEPVVVHAPNAGGDQSVQIMAMEPCWIGFTIDQDAPKDFYLYAGQRAIVRFDKTLQLRLGNAGGVRFFYNDEPFPTNYASGEVRELRFPPTPE